MTGYSNKATGNDDEWDNNASPGTCRDCIMTGRMPVRDAGGNAGVSRAVTPAQRGQRRTWDEGDNASATPATMMA
jgi:hypothetical protein